MWCIPMRAVLKEAVIIDLFVCLQAVYSTHQNYAPFWFKHILLKLFNTYIDIYT